MKFTKIIALILVLATLTISLASCSSAYKNPGKYITVPTLKDVVVKQADIDEDLAEQIKQICEDSKGKYFDDLKKDDVIQGGDKIVITYTADLTEEGLNEEEFDILSAEKLSLILGDTASSVNSKFPTEYKKDSAENPRSALGFEEQLVGKKVGEEVSIRCIFSSTFASSTALRDQEVTYKVKIESASRITVTENHELVLTYKPVDPTDEKTLEEIKDFIVTAPESDKEDDKVVESSDTTTAATSTTAAVTTGSASSSTPSTPKKFSELFKGGQLKTITFEKKDDKVIFAKGTTSFETIFALSDLDATHFIGKNLHSKIAVPLTVTSDMVKTNKDYKPYEGQSIYFVFSIDDAQNVPEWTDKFVTNYTNEAHKTTKAYEEVLLEGIRQNLAFDAIVEATTVVSYPEKELQKYYESSFDKLLAEHLQNKDKNFVSVSNYSQQQLDKLVSKSDYARIRIDAKAEAKVSVKERLVIEYLLDELDAHITKKQYKNLLKEEYDSNYLYYYYYYFQTSFSVKQLEKAFGKDYWMLQFSYAKLLEKLPAKVTISK